LGFSEGRGRGKRGAGAPLGLPDIKNLTIYFPPMTYRENSDDMLLIINNI
jgi:hypothetical protein